jgi:hypothetical protein
MANTRAHGITGFRGAWSAMGVGTEGHRRHQRVHHPAGSPQGWRLTPDRGADLDGEVGDRGEGHRRDASESRAIQNKGHREGGLSI